MNEYRQFKLLSGEEIVCEVVEWNDDVDDNDVNIIIRYPLIIKYEPLAIGADGVPSIQRAAVLIPWFLHQMQLGAVQTLNIGHCTSEAIPADTVMDYYHSTVSAMVADIEEEIDEGDEQGKYPDYMDEDAKFEADKDSSKVVDMFNKKPTTLH